jgi:hypothetical protein
MFNGLTLSESSQYDFCDYLCARNPSGNHAPIHGLNETFLSGDQSSTLADYFPSENHRQKAQKGISHHVIPMQWVR